MVAVGGTNVFVGGIAGGDCNVLLGTAVGITASVFALQAGRNTNENTIQIINKRDFCNIFPPLILYNPMIT
jgi:hypothetical protein